MIISENNEVKRVNLFFKDIIKPEYDRLNAELLLTDTQQEILRLKYIKCHDINYISDTLGYSPAYINHQLRIIRKKLIKII